VAEDGDEHGGDDVQLACGEDEAGAQAVDEVVDEGAEQVEVAGRAFAGPFLKAGFGFFVGTDVQGGGVFVVAGASVELLWVQIFLDIIIRELMPLILRMLLINPMIMRDPHFLHKLLQQHKPQQRRNKYQRDIVLIHRLHLIRLRQNMNHRIPQQRPASQSKQYPHEVLELLGFDVLAHAHEDEGGDETECGEAEAGEEAEAPALADGEVGFAVVG
jgi:hypothetical protein